MNNYTYIVSSLPVIAREAGKDGSVNSAQVLSEIMEQLSEEDNATLSLLMTGLKGKELDAEFYRKASDHGCRFIRDYFAFDLNLRNAKARYLNRALGLEESQDTIVLDEEAEEGFDEAERAAEVLGGRDILERERALDGMYWQKIEEITTFDYFDLDAILAFVAKLHIVDRWFKLDEQTGREMFRSLVSEVKSTFKGVNYTE